MTRLRSERIGEELIMNNGLKAKIISYSSEANINIQFENGIIAEKKSYKNFRKGEIRCPMGFEVFGTYVKCTNYNVLPNVVFLVDLDDLNIVKNCLWSKVGGYIYNPCKKYLHTLILKKQKGYEVDHINCDTADNRKINLRLCTRQENTRNRKLQKNNTTGHKGVHYLKEKNRFRSRISADKKRILIGDYKTPEQAAEAYNRAALLLHGKFARLNDIRRVTNETF